MHHHPDKPPDPKDSEEFHCQDSSVCHSRVLVLPFTFGLGVLFGGVDLNKSHNKFMFALSALAVICASLNDYSKQQQQMSRLRLLAMQKRHLQLQK
jgi:hypothetical protein